jgi:polysaccharide chain length determinant protein (PEP-CTERM system associated)
MQDLLEKLLGELRNSWRFRWYALAAIWGVALAGWLVVYSLPNQYRVMARVHVDTASFLRPLLHGLAVQPNLNQEVKLLTKTLLSTPNLEEIARKSNLDLGGLTQEEKSSLLDGLRQNIKLQNAGTDLYLISYTAPNPAMAKDVVQQVLNVMMTNALGSSQQSSVAAQSFLKKQVQDYAKQLNGAEQALARFKRENVGLMPSGGGDYFSQLQAVQSKREDLKNKLAIASAQERTLSQQIHAMETGQTSVRPSSDPQVQALNTQIQNDEQQLNSMLTQYTDAYPGVVDLKDRIRLEKKQRTDLISKLKNKKTGTFDPTNLVYQDLSMQLNKTSVQIQTLKTQIAQADAQIAKFKSKAGQMADIQAQFESLTRNYQVTKKQYDSLLSRLYSAQLSQSAQTSGNPLKFQVIDPPVTPLAPVAPKRHLMAFMVLIAALGAGGALAFLLSQLKPVFLTRSDLAEMFALPVIGAVSFAGAPSIQRTRRGKLALFWAGCGVFLLAGIVAILFANEGAHLVQTRLLGRLL